MNKNFYILCVVILTIGFAACSPSAVTSTQVPVAISVPEVVKFDDAAFESMIRATLGKPEGEITKSEVAAVTRLNLNNDLQRFISETTPIMNINGLENFTNLEYLDLSDHAIVDISPLTGLTKLTNLSLAGNPVANVAPLARLTNLEVLILSGCQASDYSSLSNLVNLKVLKLDNSMVTDLSPFSTLTNLRQLYLDNSSVNDFYPLEAIYPNLENKDFIIATTLVDLGFNLDSNRHQAFYDSESSSFTIHHAAWGSPPEEWDENIIRTSMYLKGGYKLLVGYYGVHKVYLCQMDKDGEQIVNYIYDTGNSDTFYDPEMEQAIRTAMDVVDGEDAFYAPVRIFLETLKNTFNMTPEKLFSLPYEPPTLKNLGFYADQPNAVYLYEYRGGKDVNMEVHRPEWGEKEFDVRFFTPISDEYRIVVTWHAAEKKFIASVDDNSMGGGSFEYYVETGEYLDIWCSYPDKTVEEYFIKAYNDPAVEDVYQHSVDLMVKYISDTFGMTIEELFTLPTGE